MDGDLLTPADTGGGVEPLGSQQSNGSWVETLSSLQHFLAQEAATEYHNDNAADDAVEFLSGSHATEPEGDQLETQTHLHNQANDADYTSGSEPYASENDRDFLFDDTSSDGSADESDEEEFGGDYNGYYYMNSDIFSLGKDFNINYVDEYLGPLFQNEVNSIYDRVVNRLRPTTDVSRVKPSDMLELLLPASLIGDFVGFVNRALSERGKPETNCDEFWVCLLAYLRAAVYFVSLFTTFDSCEAGWYGLSSQFPTTLNRCLDVLKALSGPSTTTTDYRWELLSSETKRFFSCVEEKITESNVDLFMTDQAVLSIDDDHIRQRSRRVQEETHLKVVNNPKKALGSVQTACTSALTGFFISGHYAVRHENTGATFEKLFMYIQGVRHPSDIREMREIVIAADRGYLNKETILFMSHVLCAKFIGTHKRAHEFPFVYGSGGISRHHRGILIPDKGGRAVFYATKKLRSSTTPYKPPVSLTAIAYREAVSGRVALFLTSIDDFATGWSTVPRSVRATTESNADDILEGVHVIYHTQSFKRSADAETFNALLAKMQPITVEQSSCKAWFLQRAFRFTSRTCAAYVRVVKKALNDGTSTVPEELREVFATVYSQTDRIAEQRTKPVLPLSEEQVSSAVQMIGAIDYRRIRVTELDGRLRTPGITQGGRRSDKISRLKQVLATAQAIRQGRNSELDTQARTFSIESHEPEFLREALLSWVLKPRTNDTEAMMLGRLNEPMVLPRIAAFVKRHTPPYHVKCVVETGLLSRRYSRSRMMEGSPDGVAYCTSRFEQDTTVDIDLASEGPGFCAAVEVKTLTSQRRLADAHEAKHRHGPVPVLNMTVDHSGTLYYKLTLCPEYRCQLLHHCAVTGTTDVLFAVACTTRIIYVVHVRYPDQVLEAYINYRESIEKNIFGWVGKSAEEVPTKVTDALTDQCCVTRGESFMSYYELCMAAHRDVIERNKPMYPQMQVGPVVALAWNPAKGGTDGFSRALAKLKVEITGSHQTVKHMLRFMLTQVNNAFLAYRLIQFCNSRQFTSYGGNSYKQMRKKLTKRMALTVFIRNVIDWVLNSLEELVEVDEMPKMRFGSHVQMAFTTEEMWRLRRKGKHEERKFTSRGVYDGKHNKNIRVRFRKWCAVCSSLKKISSGRSTKEGKKDCRVLRQLQSITLRQGQGN